MIEIQIQGLMPWAMLQYQQYYGVPNLLSDAGG
jgi:hypothetical protein